MIYMSLILGVLAVLAGVIISALRITMGPEFFGGQATTIVLLLLLSSFQLFFLFIIGQYVARIYDETRSRPLYVVSDTHGIDQQTIPTRRNASERSYAVASTSGFDASAATETQTSAGTSKGRSRGDG